jgi:hypothetical protein
MLEDERRVFGGEECGQILFEESRDVHWAGSCEDVGAVVRELVPTSGGGSIGGVATTAYPARPREALSEADSDE